MVDSGLGTNFKAGWCSGAQETWVKFRPHPKRVCAASLSLSFILRKQSPTCTPELSSHWRDFTSIAVAGTEGERLGFRSGHGLVSLQKFELLIWTKD